MLTLFNIMSWKKHKTWGMGQDEMGWDAQRAHKGVADALLKYTVSM